MMISAAGRGRRQQLGLVVFDDQVVGGLGRPGSDGNDGRQHRRGGWPGRAAALSEVGVMRASPCPAGDLLT